MNRLELLEQNDWVIIFKAKFVNWKNFLPQYVHQSILSDLKRQSGGAMWRPFQLSILKRRLHGIWKFLQFTVSMKILSCNVFWQLIVFSNNIRTESKCWQWSHGDHEVYSVHRSYVKKCHVQYSSPNQLYFVFFFWLILPVPIQFMKFSLNHLRFIDW